jgi:hypothetical protein
MEDILTVVRASLQASPPTPQTTNPNSMPPSSSALDIPQQQEVFMESEQPWGEEEHMYDANEVFFDDMGEGAGVEGDLDVEDD